MTMKIEDLPEFDEVHVISDGDLKEHTPSKDCWCNPTEADDCRAFLHHAMDKREEYENGRRFS